MQNEKGKIFKLIAAIGAIAYPFFELIYNIAFRVKAFGSYRPTIYIIVLILTWALLAVVLFLKDTEVWVAVLFGIQCFVNAYNYLNGFNFSTIVHLIRDLSLLSLMALLIINCVIDKPKYKKIASFGWIVAGALAVLSFILKTIEIFRSFLKYGFDGLSLLSSFINLILVAEFVFLALWVYARVKDEKPAVYMNTAGQMYGNNQNFQNNQGYQAAQNYQNNQYSETPQNSQNYQAAQSSQNYQAQQNYQNNQYSQAPQNNQSYQATQNNQNNQY